MESIGQREQERVESGAAPEISLVIPLFDEEENVGELHRRVMGSLEELGRSFEVIYVDDGSRDGTFARLREVVGADPRVEIIQFRRNFGQTAALSAGIDAAAGEIIVTMDGDLQNDPADIGRLVAELERGGWDLVSGWRRNRKDPYWSRIFPSTVANWLIARITNVQVHDLGCSLKAYRSDLIKQIELYGEMHRFLPVLAQWVGARITEMEVTHHSRLHGRSKYGLSRTFKVILDLITVKFLMSYSTQPIQIFGAWGLASIGLGFLSGLATVLMRVFGLRTMTRNPLLTLTAILIIVGVQFIILGLLGEINIRTYYESQRKRIYTVRCRYRGGRTICPRPERAGRALG
jgi:glycosyltransferase involved in cell wall biosynthesis